jgi:hypothetical protein
MSGRKLRWLGFGLVASVGVILLALTSMMNSAFAYGDVGVLSPDPDIGLAMGGSGLPIPGSEYVTAVDTRYIAPNFPDTTFPNPYANGLITPEGLYPITGVNSLPFDTSLSEGVTILNNAIESNIAAGDASTVFGYSQSATISSLEMEQLDPLGTPSNLPVQFVLIGDPNAPNGGLFERFDGLSLPSLGIDLNAGATPADDFTTVIYSAEYDGAADFPQYPINFLSDLNAWLGIYYVHGTYPDLTPAELATAITLPTSGATETTYYMIPTTDLPLLDPVRDIPIIGNPIADLLQPDLTYIVNLGYGDPLYGYSTGPANVATPFELFPPLSDFEQLPGLLVSGTEQGIQNFIGDFTGTGPNPVTLGSVSSLTSLLDPSSGMTSALSALASDPAFSLSDIINALSSAASTLYGTLLPTADMVNALLTSLPAYDVSIFLDNLSDPINAIGLPIAADTALITGGAFVEFEVLANAALAISGLLQ